AFDKAISELRAYRPEAVNKLEQAGIEKCSRAYCLSSRYNYMTSNSVESINSLTRVVRRVPITMLAEYCRDLLQRCLWVKPWFTKINLKDTYQELVYPLKDPKLWETPNDLQVVLPPIMNKRPTGRLKNKDQICSKKYQATTKRRQEHLSQEARLDEERLRNGRIYMDWIDYEATEKGIE
ncbi:hypothetical protein Tco_1278963, partial [Tanacetum coccineum]